MRRLAPRLHSMNCCAPIRQYRGRSQRLWLKAKRRQRARPGSVVLSSPASFATAAAILLLMSPAFGAEAGGTMPTYSKQVAPILYDHCTGCHRPGQIGFAQRLDSYDNAKTWASAIREQVLNRSMPPWLADPDHSAKFSNDPRLT